MNEIEKALLASSPLLYSKFSETVEEVKLLLQKYAANFPTYTDHSLDHTFSVFNIASEVLTKNEVTLLNEDELYVLAMGCILHDIGMCIPEDKIAALTNSGEFLEYKKSKVDISREEYIRDIHHLVSRNFIVDEWESLKIPSENYAKAISLVAAGHRKVDLGDFNVYNPRFFARGGREYTCLPYLSCVLRIADELDITNSRTPRLLTKYYMPNNEVSIREWRKHISTSQRNYYDGVVEFEVKCTDQNIYSALQEQFDKIQQVINYCQKIIRLIPTRDRTYNLELSKVKPVYMFVGFDPKGIKFTFDVENVVKAFIGEDLYKDNLTALREAVQNAVDACRFKTSYLKQKYNAEIKIILEPRSITISDNGSGMDTFVIEHFFGRLASSFYEQEKIKNQFEAIGQFGVGVFSYFLLAEYVDIETKTDTTEAVRFRFDKDPKSYFHFFDTTSRDYSGTTVKLFLKDNFSTEATPQALVDYIRKTFKHIEIPIKIESQGDVIMIENTSFKLSNEIHLLERLKLQHKKKIDHLSLFEVNVDNDLVRGNCALIVNQNTRNVFNVDGRYFDDDQFDVVYNSHTESEISVSQKGVFVNNYSSDFLNFVVGDIDLKRKLKINIDRNKFSDNEEIEGLLNIFSFELLEQLFIMIGKLSLTDREKLTNSSHFLEKYLTYVPLSEFLRENTTISLLQNIWVEYYSNTSTKVCSLFDIQSVLQSIVIVETEEYIEPLKNRGYNNIIIASKNSNYNNLSTFASLFTNLMSRKVAITYIEGTGYYEILPENNSLEINTIKRIKNVVTRFYRDFMTSNRDSLLVIAGDSEATSDWCINLNHPLIQYIIANHEDLQTSFHDSRILKEAFNSIMSFIHTEMPPDVEKISDLNELLKPILVKGALRNLSASDFDN